MAGPPNKPNGSHYNEKSSKRIGGLGDPMTPTKINKGRGILGFLLNPEAKHFIWGYYGTQYRARLYSPFGYNILYTGILSY